MKNFIQMGNTLTATLAAAASSGDPVLINGIFGIASTDGEIADDVEIQVTGVFSLPKKSADEPAQFAAAYWDAANDEVTVTATDNTKIGVFTKAYSSGSTSAEVRLDGVSV